jgi:hypothetical protein
MKHSIAENPNITEFEIGQRIYWRSNTALREWYWGRIVGIYFNDLWVCKSHVTFMGQAFIECEPPQGGGAPETLPARRAHAGPAWKHEIAGELPHVRYANV